MTVRALIVTIDDEQPLGPQVRAARAVLEWKLVGELAGECYSIRHLKRIEDMSEISDRHTVQRCTIMTAQVLSVEQAFMNMFSPSGPTWIPLPTTSPSPSVPVPNTGESTAAAAAARLAAAKQVGRSATILEDYGQAIQAPPARAAALGAA